jgi:hypothetical protein
MDIDGLIPKMRMPHVPDPTAPRREIELPDEDVATVYEAIETLDKSSSNKNDLFDIFSEWQSKRTLTSKRVFVSTSIVVAAASWIGIDYKELSFFGLKIADGDPNRFIIFVLVAIVLSGVFYEASRRIDASVRKAKIANVRQDMEELVEPVKSIDEVMRKNSIDSFSDLYFDFKSALVGGSTHQPLDAYGAVQFFRKHLSGAGRGLTAISIIEQAIIYGLAAYAVVALLVALK